MTTERKGTTLVQLPDGPVEAAYDDTDPPARYDQALADRTTLGRRRNSCAGQHLFRDC